jgi:hypothetical protein
MFGVACCLARNYACTFWLSCSSSVVATQPLYEPANALMLQPHLCLHRLCFCTSTEYESNLFDNLHDVLFDRESLFTSADCGFLLRHKSPCCWSGEVVAVVCVCIEVARMYG